MQPTVLYVDNSAESLPFRQRYLENAGYRCLVANSIEDARDILNRAVVHLVVTDYRLIKDEDPDDHSGQQMLREIPSHIPAIVYTAYPLAEAARAAMRASAIDFVDSRRPPEELLGAVEWAFENKVKVNFELKVPDRSMQLLRLLIRNLDESPNSVADVAVWEAHMDNIIRRIFSDMGDEGDDDRSQRYLRVSLYPLQQGGGGSQVMVATPFTTQSDPEPTREIVVKFGLAHAVREEYSRYRRWVADFLSGCSTAINPPAYSGDLGATPYSFAGGTSRNVTSLQNHYGQATTAQVQAMLERLFRETCAEWHKHTREARRKETISTLYRDLLGLGKPWRLQRMDERIRSYCLVSRPGLQIVERPSSRRIEIRLPNREPEILPHPRHFLDENRVAVPGGYVSIVHGDMHVGNVLTDTSGMAWLIDFGRTTDMGPLFADFAELETSIKIDLLSEEHVDALLRLESCLAQQRLFETCPSLPQDLESNAEIAKCYRVVGELRRIAGECFPVGDMRPYYVGLLFNAMDKLAIRASGAIGQSRQARTRAIHSFLSAATIAQALENWG